MKALHVKALSITNSIVNEFFKPLQLDNKLGGSASRKQRGVGVGSLKEGNEVVERLWDSTRRLEPESL